MPLHWRPVGPEPDSTYWVRRAVLVLAVVVVLWGLIALLTGGGDDQLDTAADSPTASATPSPEPTDEPRAEPSEEPSESPSPSPSDDTVECADADLELTAEADKQAYAPSDKPVLTLTVRNTSDRPCRRDLGQGASELIVTSGRDRIWSSDDCSPGGPPGPVVLAPDQADVQRLTWEATRSRPGCDGEKPQVEPGTYVVSARNGELRADGDSFRFEG